MTTLMMSSPFFVVRLRSVKKSVFSEAPFTHHRRGRRKGGWRSPPLSWGRRPALCRPVPGLHWEGGGEEEGAALARPPARGASEGGRSVARAQCRAEPEQCGCRSDAEPGRPGVERKRRAGAERRACRGEASVGLTAGRSGCGARVQTRSATITWGAEIFNGHRCLLLPRAENGHRWEE